MVGSAPEISPRPKDRKQTPWLFGAAMIAIPIAFVGMLTIAPRLPNSVPGPPSPVFAVPFGSRTAKVIWRTPINGGSAITGFRVTPYLGFLRQPTRLVPATATNAVFTGLRNGRRYQFEVTAENGVGIGDVSRRTMPIIVGAPGQPLQATVTTLTSGSLAVAFAAPNTGGAPISSFGVTCESTNGGATRTASGLADPIAIGDLTIGKSYACTVRATNNLGTGPGSPLSAQAKT